MRLMTAALAVCVMLCVSANARSAEQPEHPGAAVYARHCAACHDEPDTSRAPTLEAIQQLNAEALRLSLTQGVMQQQATDLSRRELAQVIDYLALKEAESDVWYAGMMCSGSKRPVDLEQPIILPRVGVDYQSTRRMSSEQAGLSSADLADLELAWAIGLPDTNALNASPVIVGNTMFYNAGQTGRVLALDVAEPCVKWIYDSGTQLRTSVTYGLLGGVLGSGGTESLLFADRQGKVHAIDAATGELIWKAEARHSPNTGISGSPILFEDRVLVSVSGSGVGRGANPEYECCVEHGAVVALDARTGDKLWTYHTMEDATYTGKTSRTGVKLRGPSGAPIWLI